ncbi:hypothetical protein KY290_009585 [Solanum tuberosum]|uniref:DAGKc domain-containing protein n=1 Tax=Solanum tuberosum TaxID=4113 RepID=A0ABQ7VVE7_SOLTU|nr:hypothetical protein KY289_009975 [Solanum tuberosum]KAH0710664.1 hypothetical protein KY284_012091 [Solanum tuberosum]KAH0772448.1 hypothetical protein KY290_009585 [Solanum tuberosum]
MVDTSLTSLNESIFAFRQRFDFLQSSHVLSHSTPRRIPDSVFLPRFSGDNPAVWVLQAEKYFAFHNILSEHKLSLASFYFDGDALEWYRWLFRNKQLAGWDHFVEKMLIRFRSRTRDKYSEFVSIPKQHEAAENYITNSYSPQHLNAHSDRNKPSLAYTLFKEMSDGETNCFRDETMVLPETQVCHLSEQGNVSVSLEISYDLFAENSEVDHMFDKMPEKCNEVDSLDNTSVGSNINTFDDMDSRPISSIPSLYDQMVSNPNLSNNPTKEPLSELSQYDNDQSGREGRQNVRPISYETPPPQEYPTNLLLCVFGAHNDHSMNTFFMREVVDDAKLVEAITAAKYRNMVVVGEEYNDCELLDDLGVFAMDEETIKYFSISTTRVFANNIRSSCVIGCGHNVARSLIGDPNFSWTVIFKECVLKEVDKTVDNTSPFFTNIYLLVDDIPTHGSTIGWNARLAQLTVGMVVPSAHRHKPQDSKLVHNGNNSEMLELMADSESDHNSIHRDFYIITYVLALNASSNNLRLLDVHTCPVLLLINSKGGGQLGGELLRTFRHHLNKYKVFDLGDERLKGNGDRFSAEIEERMSIIVAGEDGTAGWLLGVVCDLTVSQQPPIATVPLKTGKENLFLENWFPITDAVGLHLNFNLDTGICCRDICHFRCVMILVKVGQVIAEEIRVMLISLLLLDDNIELHFASDNFLWLLLLDVGLLSNFTLETLHQVDIATPQIIEKVVDRFHDLNLEDKVLNWDGGIVMNQVQPNVDTNVIQVVIGPTRAIGPRTSNRSKLIWDPG